MMELWSLIALSPLVLPSSWWVPALSFCLLGSVLMWAGSIALLSSLHTEDLSMVLLTLTAGVTILMLSYEGFKTGSPWLFCIFVALLWSLSFCFATLSSFYFYLLFEFSLVPMALLILGWGAQPERLLASVYMLFYTICASLPLLFLVLMQSSPWFFGLERVVLTSFAQAVVSAAVSLAFLVKLPMFLLHLWLPKAHVEAPCTGSMFLAGVLLKLGGFGLYRFMSLVSMPYAGAISSLGLAGASLAGFATLVQNDLKAMVAYSSVVHMGLILASLLLKSPVGLLGAVWMMVAHGFCSSALFCLGTSVYERVSTRNLLVCQGLLSLTPILGLLWALSILANSSAPPSLNLFSESLMIWSCTSLRIWLLGPIAGIIILSLAYGLFLYSKTFSGLSPDTQTSFSEDIKELILGSSHLVWLLLAPLYVFVWMLKAKGSYRPYN